jgi:hypothetical protein
VGRRRGDDRVMPAAYVPRRGWRCRRRVVAAGGLHDLSSVARAARARVGLMVLRVQFRSRPRLRARVLSVTDLAPGDVRVEAAHSIQELCELVENWLWEVVHPGSAAG